MNGVVKKGIHDTDTGPQAAGHLQDTHRKAALL